MEILKRSMAPLTDAAWEMVDGAVARVLRASLAGRRLAKVEGPKGWDYAAVGLGKLDVPSKQAQGGVAYGVHTVQPLVEARASFQLEVWEMDDVSRGSETPDLRPAEEAARKMAAFEDEAIFRGFAAGKIAGLAAGSGLKPVSIGTDLDGLFEGIARALLLLKENAVIGPYALALGARPYEALAGAAACCPPLGQIEEMIEGKVIYAPAIDGGILASMRGGDRKLVLGHDLSIGYEAHDARKVRLFLSESFTFRILEPIAHVLLQPGAARRGRGR
jgi:uncharacterized linocin/CFP29 family protein